MIRMTPIQAGRRLEITLNTDEPRDATALEIITRSLERSPYDSHHAVLKQIENQMTTGVPLIRFSLNVSGVERIERSLRHVYSAKKLYPTRTHCDLHEALCKTLGIRLSVAQG